ncbi:hypothetical protein HK101_000172 [Irineochytrium annulatum]|nr:hypothetical protein HK101_000172 [Irineochytrium annulatum]
MLALSLLTSVTSALIALLVLYVNLPQRNLALTVLSADIALLQATYLVSNVALEFLNPWGSDGVFSYLDQVYNGTVDAAGNNGTDFGARTVTEVSVLLNVRGFFGNTFGISAYTAALGIAMDLYRRVESRTILENRSLALGQQIAILMGIPLLLGIVSLFYLIHIPGWGAIAYGSVLTIDCSLALISITSAIYTLIAIITFRYRRSLLARSVAGGLDLCNRPPPAAAVPHRSVLSPGVTAFHNDRDVGSRSLTPGGHCIPIASPGASVASPNTSAAQLASPGPSSAPRPEHLVSAGLSFKAPDASLDRLLRRMIIFCAIEIAATVPFTTYNLYTDITATQPGTIENGVGGGDVADEVIGENALARYKEIWRHVSGRRGVERRAKELGIELEREDGWGSRGDMGEAGWRYPSSQGRSQPHMPMKVATSSGSSSIDSMVDSLS